MKQNENSNAIQKTVAEITHRLAVLARECSDRLEAAVSDGRKLEVLKIQGYIAGVMDAAVSVSRSPGKCVGDLIAKEEEIETEIGSSDDVSDILFAHGRQRAIRQAIDDLQDAIVGDVDDPAVKRDPGWPASTGDADTGPGAPAGVPAVDGDGDGDGPYVQGSHSYPAGRSQARRMSDRRVKYGDVLEWAAARMDGEGGDGVVFIPCEDVIRQFWLSGGRPMRYAIVAMHGFLWRYRLKGVVKLHRVGRTVVGFSLVPDWRERVAKPLRVGPSGGTPSAQGEEHAMETSETEGADNGGGPDAGGFEWSVGGPEEKRAIAGLDMDGLAAIARQTLEEDGTLRDER